MASPGPWCGTNLYWDRKQVFRAVIFLPSVFIFLKMTGLCYDKGKATSEQPAGFLPFESEECEQIPKSPLAGGLYLPT